MRSGVLAAGLASWKARPASATQVKLSTPNMEKLGWQLSVQLYTYRRFPLFEALDMVAALGIRHIEPLTVLPVDSKRPDVRANEDMPADVRKQLKAMLAERGMFLSSVFAKFSGKSDQTKRLFDFCKEMGTGTIVAEPPADALDMIEKLCVEYGINVAFHNHARGQSPYWKPEQVLAACQNRTLVEQLLGMQYFAERASEAVEAEQLGELGRYVCRPFRAGGRIFHEARLRSILRDDRFLNVAETPSQADSREFHGNAGI